MRLKEIDLTREKYIDYIIWEHDIVSIKFNDTEIIMNSREFDKLKEDIIKQNGLAKVEFNVANDVGESTKSEVVLKEELRKTIDRIVDLQTKYDSTYFELMEEIVSPTFIDRLKIKDKLYPMLERKSKLMGYKEKLEAQLKYGELQWVWLK